MNSKKDVHILKKNLDLNHPATGPSLGELFKADIIDENTRNGIVLIDPSATRAKAKAFVDYLLG